MDKTYYPTLTEPGVKYFLKESLKICNRNRVNYNNILFPY